SSATGGWSNTTSSSAGSSSPSTPIAACRRSGSLRPTSNARSVSSRRRASCRGSLSRCGQSWLYGLLPVYVLTKAETSAPTTAGVITGTIEAPAGAGEQILTKGALEFVELLEHDLGPARRELLERRRERQAAIDAGERPDFLAATRDMREGDWRVARAPADLRDRRCEITGPVDRKMMINALNSGARV